MALLTVENLSISVRRDGASVPVVTDASFAVDRGATLGIVGESGSGKSLTSLAVMGLLEGSSVSITDGRILFDGQDLATLGARARRKIRGAGMAMVFQEPMTSLNPVYRVGDQIVEAIVQHRPGGRRAARRRAAELLELVRLPDPVARLDAYPHQLSGGQRQRVMIAMALACDPALLIADEPTTALDVTVQAQILDLLGEIQARLGTAIVLISHDLGVIAETCDEVCVMYRGRIVERAPAPLLFDAPRHPYTLALMRSIPDADAVVERLEAIPGRVPDIDQVVPGCDFHPRCARAGTVCAREIPPETVTPGGHRSRCHFADSVSR